MLPKMVSDIMQVSLKSLKGLDLIFKSIASRTLKVNMTVAQTQEGEQPVIEADELASRRLIYS